jgi:hypothetical protein
VNDRKQKKGVAKAKKKTPRAARVLRAEHDKNELVTDANDRFLRSCAQIKDVYAKIAK